LANDGIDGFCRSAVTTAPAWAGIDAATKAEPDATSAAKVAEANNHPRMFKTLV